MKKDVTPIKPTFKNNIYLCMQTLTNFPFIEEDFDALTNYELLCKVVEYLNKIAANDNVQNENILALVNALNDLKNYVDNLDLQEEVNNKLDEMLEDGQLEQIIEQFLNSTAIWCYDTVDDMKSATNLVNGSYAKTLGYYSINDGGQALYYISDTASGIYEELDDLYAILIESNINPLQLGCKNNQDNTTLINKMVNNVIGTINDLDSPNISVNNINNVMLSTNINNLKKGDF